MFVGIFIQYLPALLVQKLGAISKQKVKNKKLRQLWVYKFSIVRTTQRRSDLYASISLEAEHILVSNELYHK